MEDSTASCFHSMSSIQKSIHTARDKGRLAHMFDCTLTIAMSRIVEDNVSKYLGGVRSQ